MAARAQYAFQARVFFRLLCVQPHHGNEIASRRNSIMWEIPQPWPSFSLDFVVRSKPPCNGEDQISPLLLREQSYYITTVSQHLSRAFSPNVKQDQ